MTEEHQEDDVSWAKSPGLWAKTREELFAELHTGPLGLSSEEAARRRAQQPNETIRQHESLRLLATQFTSPSLFC